MNLSDEGENFLDIEEYERDFFLSYQSIKNNRSSDPKVVQHLQAKIAEVLQDKSRKHERKRKEHEKAGRATPSNKPGRTCM